MISLNIRSISENLANDYINTAFNLLDKVSAKNERKDRTG